MGDFPIRPTTNSRLSPLFPTASNEKLDRAWERSYQVNTTQVQLMWRSLMFAQFNSFTGKVESGQLREMVSWRGRDASSLIYSITISGNCSLHPTLHVRCYYSTVTAFEQDLSVSWRV